MQLEFQYAYISVCQTFVSSARSLNLHGSLLMGRVSDSPSFFFLRMSGLKAHLKYLIVLCEEVKL